MYVSSHYYIYWHIDMIWEFESSARENNCTNYLLSKELYRPHAWYLSCWSQSKIITFIPVFNFSNKKLISMMDSSCGWHFLKLQIHQIIRVYLVMFIYETLSQLHDVTANFLLPTGSFTFSFSKFNTILSYDAKFNIPSLNLVNQIPTNYNSKIPMLTSSGWEKRESWEIY